MPTKLSNGKYKTNLRYPKKFREITGITSESLNIVDYSSMLPYGSKSLLLQLLSKNYPLLISPKDYMLLVKVG
ncbi:TPA: hypothetical protein ACGO5C_002131 [Streptococcus suis]